MKTRAIFLAILTSALLACDNAGQSQSLQPEISPPEMAPVLEPNPDPVRPANGTTVSRQKHLNTQITPEMIKDLRFDISSEPAAGELSLQPGTINSPNKTRIMITPKVFLDESEDIKKDYLDYIDGAAVQLEVKFD